MVLNFSDKDYAHLLDVTLKELAKKIETLPYDLDIAWTAYGHTLSAMHVLSELVSMMNYSGFLLVLYIDSKMWQRDNKRQQRDEQNFGMILHYVNSGTLVKTVEKRMYMFNATDANAHKYNKLNEAEAIFMKTAVDIDLYNRLQSALVEMSQLLKVIYFEETGSESLGKNIKSIIPDDIEIDKFDASLERSIELSSSLIFNLNNGIDLLKKKLPNRSAVESTMLWYAVNMEFTINNIHDAVVEYGATCDLDLQLPQTYYDALTDKVIKENDDAIDSLIQEREDVDNSADIVNAKYNSPFNINFYWGELYIITMPFTRSATPILEACKQLAHDFRDYLDGGYDKMFTEVMKEEGLC